MRKHTKLLVRTFVTVLIISILPLFAFAGTGVPSKTRITKINYLDGKVTLKWKKVKCKGYKVYRKINNGKKKCIKTIRRRKRIKFTDNIPKYVTGDVSYQIATYNRKKIGKKYKYYKKFSKAKSVTVNARIESADAIETEITEEIYNEYSTTDINDLDIKMVRALVLYKVNDIRMKKGYQPVELDSFLNNLAQQVAESDKYISANELNIQCRNTPGYEKYEITLPTRTEIEIDEAKDVKTLVHEWVDLTYIEDAMPWPYIDVMGVGYNGKYIVQEYGMKDYTTNEFYNK